MPENILDLIDKFDLYVFDIYGVLWNGKSVIPGADNTLEKLKKAGKKVLIMSNGTALSRQIEESYGRRGFIKGIHYDKVVSSGDAYHTYVLNDKRNLKFYQFGRPSKVLFEGSRYVELQEPDEADFVYAGVPQTFDGEIWRDYLTIEPFAEELLHLIKMNKTLVCANPDLKAFENQYEEAVVRQGSVAKFYAEHGGDVEYWGKPYGNIYDFALRDEPLPRDRMLMVGDTLQTDILGGKNYGMKTALIRRGISELNMQEAGMSDILDYARSLGIIPDYIFEP